MIYRAKTLEDLKGGSHWSNQSLDSHLVLYQGYVANANHLSDLMQGVVRLEKTKTVDLTEIKRRFG